jgi:hypothetical protein
VAFIVALQGIPDAPEVVSGTLVEVVAEAHITGNALDILLGYAAALDLAADQVPQTALIALGGPQRPVLVAGDRGEVGHQTVKIRRLVGLLGRIDPQGVHELLPVPGLMCGIHVRVLAGPQAMRLPSAGD